MTIAAGLLCKEGVLLCADSEHVDWETKSQGCKVHWFEVPGCKVAYAYAGNSLFAISAMQKCERKLAAKAAQGAFDARDEIEKLLDKEYRRNVWSNPAHADILTHYSFLIALWTSAKTELFITNQTALDRVTSFECLGIGEPLARFLIRPAHSREMPYRQALPLAAYALALVKDSIKDCDGVSIFTLIGRDGTISTTTSEPLTRSLCAQIEYYAKGYEFLSRKLFLHLADQANERYFAENLQHTFVNDVLRIASEMRDHLRTEEEELARRNPRLSEDQVKTLAIQLSMGIAPNLKPSPE